MKSLRARLILAATLILAVFIVLAGYTLDKAFYESAESNLQENLNTQLTLLMASTEVNDDNDVDMPTRLLETKFSLPSSGLYAIITNAKGKVVWKSLSTVGVIIPKPKVLPAGQQVFERIQLENEEFYIRSYGINWFIEKGKVPLTFNIISDMSAFNEQIYNFRATLWGWLIGLATILLLLQVMILVWGLKPLGRVVNELSNIESGKQDRIEQDYPTEILRLTSNINGLLEHEHTQQTRYRNALADLAHSLKTPLAVLTGGLQEIQHDKTRESFQEQIQRMDHIIGHQLQRAATAGGSPIRKQLAFRPILDKLIKALGKVYRDKNIQFDQHIPDGMKLRVDEGDIMEVMGNVLDNACKWCKQRVRISVSMQNKRARITIADDGPGINQEQVELILQRGGRLDQSVPGQGIGLSVVVDILDAYKGKLSVTHSDLGGSAFTLDLPAT